MKARFHSLLPYSDRSWDEILDENGIYLSCTDSGDVSTSRKKSSDSGCVRVYDAASGALGVEFFQDCPGEVDGQLRTGSLILNNETTFNFNNYAIRVTFFGASAEVVCELSILHVQRQYLEILNHNDTLLGRYVIEYRIGAGGMGIVYKASDNQLRRHVALKVAKNEVCNDENGWKGARGLERLRREAEIGATINDSHIVHVESFEDIRYNSEYYIAFLVMEYVDGGSLSHLLKQYSKCPDVRPFPAELALLIVRDIAKSLVTLNDRQTVHRDISPDNIMFDSSGNVKLADLGIAKMQHAELELTKSEIMGKWAYMAPERYSGLGTVDIRSDVYSLGIVAYYMLTGSLPYKTKTDISISMDKPLPKVSSLRQIQKIEGTSVSVWIDELVSSMTRKNVEKRFFPQDLLNCLNNGPYLLDSIRQDRLGEFDTPRAVIKAVAKLNTGGGSSDQGVELPSGFLCQREVAKTFNWRKAALVASLVVVMLVAFGMVLMNMNGNKRHEFIVQAEPGSVITLMQEEKGWKDGGSCDKRRMMRFYLTDGDYEISIVHPLYKRYEGTVSVSGDQVFCPPMERKMCQLNIAYLPVNSVVELEEKTDETRQYEGGGLRYEFRPESNYVAGGQVCQGIYSLRMVVNGKLAKKMDDVELAWHTKELTMYSLLTMTAKNGSNVSLRNNDEDYSIGVGIPNETREGVFEWKVVVPQGRYSAVAELKDYQPCNRTFTINSLEQNTHFDQKKIDSKPREEGEPQWPDIKDKYLAQSWTDVKSKYGELKKLADGEDEKSFARVFGELSGALKSPVFDSTKDKAAEVMEFAKRIKEDFDKTLSVIGNLKAELANAEDSLKQSLKVKEIVQQRKSLEALRRRLENTGRNASMMNRKDSIKKMADQVENLQKETIDKLDKAVGEQLNNHIAAAADCEKNFTEHSLEELNGICENFAEEADSLREMLKSTGVGDHAVTEAGRKIQALTASFKEKKGQAFIEDMKKRLDGMCRHGQNMTAEDFAKEYQKLENECKRPPVLTETQNNELKQVVEKAKVAYNSFFKDKCTAFLKEYEKLVCKMEAAVEKYDGLDDAVFRKADEDVVVKEREVPPFLRRTGLEEELQKLRNRAEICRQRVQEQASAASLAALSGSVNKLKTLQEQYQYATFKDGRQAYVELLGKIDALPQLFGKYADAKEKAAKAAAEQYELFRSRRVKYKLAAIEESLRQIEIIFRQYERYNRSDMTGQRGEFDLRTRQDLSPEYLNEGEKAKLKDMISQAEQMSRDFETLQKGKDYLVRIKEKVKLLEAYDRNHENFNSSAIDSIYDDFLDELKKVCALNDAQKEQFMAMQTEARKLRDSFIEKKEGEFLKDVQLAFERTKTLNRSLKKDDLEDWSDARRDFSEAKRLFSGTCEAVPHFLSEASKGKLKEMAKAVESFEQELENRIGTEYASTLENCLNVVSADIYAPNFEERLEAAVKMAGGEKDYQLTEKDRRRLDESKGRLAKITGNLPNIRLKRNYVDSLSKALDNMENMARQPGKYTEEAFKRQVGGFEAIRAKASEIVEPALLKKFDDAFGNVKQRFQKMKSAVSYMQAVKKSEEEVRKTCRAGMTHQVVLADFAAAYGKFQTLVRNAPENVVLPSDMSTNVNACKRNVAQMKASESVVKAVTRAIADSESQLDDLKKMNTDGSDASWDDFDKIYTGLTSRLDVLAGLDLEAVKVDQIQKLKQIAEQCKDEFSKKKQAEALTMKKLKLKELTDVVSTLEDRIPLCRIYSVKEMKDAVDDARSKFDAASKLGYMAGAEETLDKLREKIDVAMGIFSEAKQKQAQEDEEQKRTLDYLNDRVDEVKKMSERADELPLKDMDDKVNSVVASIQGVREKTFMRGCDAELGVLIDDVRKAEAKFKESKKQQAEREAKAAEKERKERLEALVKHQKLLEANLENYQDVELEDMDRVVKAALDEINDACKCASMKTLVDALHTREARIKDIRKEFVQRKTAWVQQKQQRLEALGNLVTALDEMVQNYGSVRMAQMRQAVDSAMAEIEKARGEAFMKESGNILDELKKKVEKHGKTFGERKEKVFDVQRREILVSLNKRLSYLEEHVKMFRNVIQSVMDADVVAAHDEIKRAQKDECFVGHEEELKKIAATIDRLAKTFRENKDALAKREEDAVRKSLNKCVRQLEARLGTWQDVTRQVMDADVKAALDEVAKARNVVCMAGCGKELDAFEKQINDLAGTFRERKSEQEKRDAENARQRRLEQERKTRLASLEEYLEKLNALLGEYQNVTQVAFDTEVKLAHDAVAKARTAECMAKYGKELDVLEKRIRDLDAQFKERKREQERREAENARQRRLEQERDNRLASLNVHLEKLKALLDTCQDVVQSVMDKAVATALEEVAKVRNDECMAGCSKRLDEINGKIEVYAEEFKKAKKSALEKRLAQERNTRFAEMDDRLNQLRQRAEKYESISSEDMEHMIKETRTKLDEAGKDECMKGYDDELSARMALVNEVDRTFRKNKREQAKREAEIARQKEMKQRRMAKLEALDGALAGLKANGDHYLDVSLEKMTADADALKAELDKAMKDECFAGHENVLKKISKELEDIVRSFEEKKRSQAEHERKLERRRTEILASMDGSRKSLEELLKSFETCETMDAQPMEKAVKDALAEIATAHNEECMKGLEKLLKEREASVLKIKQDFERMAKELVARQNEQIDTLAKGVVKIRGMVEKSDTVSHKDFDGMVDGVRKAIGKTYEQKFMKGTESKIRALEKELEACISEFGRKKDAQASREMLESLQRQVCEFEKLTADVSTVTDDDADKSANGILTMIGAARKEGFMAKYGNVLDELAKKVKDSTAGFKAAKRDAWEKEVFAQINGRLDGLKRQVEKAGTVPKKNMEKDVKDCQKLIEEVRKHKYADKVAGKLKDMEVEADSLLEDFLRRKDGIAADEILNGLEEKLKKIQGKYEEPGLRMTMTEYDKEMANFTSLASGLDDAKRGMADPVRQKRLASMKTELEKIKMAISSQEDRIVGANVKEVFLAKVTKVPRGTDKKNSKAYSVWKAEMREAMKTFLERPMADGDEEAYLLTQDCKILEPGLFGIQEKGPGESQEKGLFELMEYVSFFDALGYNDWARVDTLIKTLGSCQDALTGIQTEKVRNSLAVFYGEQLRRQSDVIQRKMKIVYTENTMKVRNRASEAIKDAQRKLEKLVMADK